jgi:hypothetical protein
MYQLHATTTTAAGVAKQPKRSHPDSIATFRALAGQAEVCSALWSRPTIWVPGGVLIRPIRSSSDGGPVVVVARRSLYNILWRLIALMPC